MCLLTSMLLNAFSPYFDMYHHHILKKVIFGLGTPGGLKAYKTKSLLNLFHIYCSSICMQNFCPGHRGLPVGFLLLWFSVLFTVESLSLLYLLVMF